MLRPVLHELATGFVIEDGSVFNDRPVFQTIALLLAWRASHWQVASTWRWKHGAHHGFSCWDMRGQLGSEDGLVATDLGRTTLHAR